MLRLTANANVLKQTTIKTKYSQKENKSLSQLFCPAYHQLEGSASTARFCESTSYVQGNISASCNSNFIGQESQRTPWQGGAAAAHSHSALIAALLIGR